MKIDDLVSDLKPVKPVLSLKASFAALLVGSFVMGWALFLIGFHFHGKWSELPHGIYYLQGGLLFLILLVGYFALSEARIPGTYKKTSKLLLLFLLAALAIILNILNHFQVGHLFTEGREGMECTWGVLLLSVPSTIFVFVFLSRGAVTNYIQTALLGVVANISLGAFLLPFACDYADPAHLFVSHLLLPMAISSVISIICAKFIFRW